MVFKLDTKKIKDRHYCTGMHLISERGKPDSILEYSTSLCLDWVDENVKYQWEIITNESFDSKIELSESNRPFILAERPIALSVQEISKKREEFIHKEIVLQVSFVDVINALVDFKNGDTAKLDAIEQKLNDIKAKAAP